MGGQGYRRALRNMPTGDLREIINEGCDARDIIESRCQEHGEGFRNLDDSDRFLVFTRKVTYFQCSKEFEPVGITKYEGKKARRQ